MELRSWISLIAFLGSVRWYRRQSEFPVRHALDLGLEGLILRKVFFLVSTRTVHIHALSM